MFYKMREIVKPSCRPDRANLCTSVGGVWIDELGAVKYGNNDMRLGYRARASRPVCGGRSQVGPITVRGGLAWEDPSYGKYIRYSC